MKKLIVILLVCLSFNAFSQGIKAGLTSNTKFEPSYTFGVFYVHNFGKVKLGVSLDYLKTKGKSETNISGEKVKNSNDCLELPLQIGFGEKVYLFTGLVPRHSHNLSLGFQAGLGSYVKFDKTFVNLESKITYNKNLMLFFTIGYGINLQR